MRRSSSKRSLLARAEDGVEYLDYEAFKTQKAKAKPPKKKHCLCCSKERSTLAGMRASPSFSVCNS